MFYIENPNAKWKITLEYIEGIVNLIINESTVGYFDEERGLVLFNAHGGAGNYPFFDHCGWLKILHEDFNRCPSQVRTVELVYNDPLKPSTDV
jgi:hypothetical protein